MTAKAPPDIRKKTDKEYRSSDVADVVVVELSVAMINSGQRFGGMNIYLKY